MAPVWGGLMVSLDNQSESAARSRPVLVHSNTAARRSSRQLALPSLLAQESGEPHLLNRFEEAVTTQPCIGG